jgi:hypothetical protein
LCANRCSFYSGLGRSASNARHSLQLPRNGSFAFDLTIIAQNDPDVRRAIDHMSSKSVGQWNFVCRIPKRGGVSPMRPFKVRQEMNMPSTRKRRIKEDVSTLNIPREKWGKFLETFSRRHRRWLVQLETYDLVTAEKVASQETRLESIELDLEDEKNPRINVIVQIDNKVIKHILFQPSLLVLESSNDGREQSLRIETVNTETTVHFRPPAPPSA